MILTNRFNRRLGGCRILQHSPMGLAKIDHTDFDDLSLAHLPHMGKHKSTLVSLNLEALKR
jgi:hypothetical protein